MMWSVELLDERVRAELLEQSKDIRACFEYLSTLIRDCGIECLPRSYVDHVQGPLWELRLRGRDGISRALYVTATGRRVVVVRIFVKKTQKTPLREIRLALERTKEVL